MLMKVLIAYTVVEVAILPVMLIWFYWKICRWMKHGQLSMLWRPAAMANGRE